MPCQKLQLNDQYSLAWFSDAGKFPKNFPQFSIIWQYAGVCSDITASKATTHDAAANDADDRSIDVEPDDDEQTDAEQTDAERPRSIESGDADVQSVHSEQSVIIVSDSDSHASALSITVTTQRPPQSYR